MTGYAIRCLECPHQRLVPQTVHAADIAQCTLCPANTYGPRDYKKPCIRCSTLYFGRFRTTNGHIGHDEPSECRFCLGKICGSVLATIMILVSILLCGSLTRYLIYSVPPWPRLKRVPRAAFILGNSQYKHYPSLPGAASDSVKMMVALEEAGFEVRLHTNVETAKDLLNFKRPGNIMELFLDWCNGTIAADSAESSIEKNDALVYYAGHGIRFHGCQWIVPTRTHIKLEQSVLFQCVQFDWMRLYLSKNEPRVTVFVLDCCQVAAPNIPQFASAPIIKKAVRHLPAVSQLIDVRALHKSRAALNVYIFHGAALSTEAKESQSGG